ncbi:MAG: gliding motility protein GldL [Prevotella sp.]|nr:gliding motility protein GldL [Prevotella sp.]MBR7042627.1 gliding motility protein GldL [Prevotella sp.]
MTQYSKYNVIYRLQKWLDSVPGQTFMNYAYSWGAAIVILGALFKLTHIPGANLMLFIGMGTEVLVFFISGFDRPFDKTEEGRELPTHVNLDGDEAGETVVKGTGGGTIIIGGSGTGTAVGGVVGTGEEASRWEGKPAAAVGGGVIGGGAWVAQQQENTPEMAEAQGNYVEELNRLTEMLQKVSEQSQRLTRDSEEMENLNRTLTGICKVYEMQLKGASQQIGTIDEINEQSRKMAQQIAELNKIYTRMIDAMTVNMKNVEG